ncbi:MAG TPA: RhuM family protein [Steroidobacteraceae bacterium]|nr:RhuM family protein [Steroidobacteraceae bacterium]
MPIQQDKGSVGEIVLYQTEDGQTRIECRFEDDSLWLTQAQMAELFQTTPQNITLHLKAIYAEAEQDETATCKSHLQVRNEGERRVQRKLSFYRLEAVLAVGFRVRSRRGTKFRQWATAQLQEYLAKGFLLDDQRLKNPGEGRPDYFDEVLERIRDIRSAEKRMYLKVGSNERGARNSVCAGRPRCHYCNVRRRVFSGMSFGGKATSYRFVVVNKTIASP